MNIIIRKKERFSLIGAKKASILTVIAVVLLSTSINTVFSLGEIFTGENQLPETTEGNVTTGNTVETNTGDTVGITGTGNMIDKQTDPSEYKESSDFDKTSGKENEQEQKKDKEKITLDTRVKQETYLSDKQYRQQRLQGKDFMIGDTTIDMNLLDGTLHVPVILESRKTKDNQKAQVTLSESTVLRMSNNKIFTGSLAAPIFVANDMTSPAKDKKIVSIVKIGDQNESILLTNTGGENVTSTIKVALPGSKDGDPILIRYSQTGQSRKILGSTNIFLEEGESFVQFETSHFTYFSLEAPIGTFTINNDDYTTSGTAVILASNVYGATHMRFANTASGINAANRSPYEDSHNRSLESWDGYQVVYAQFSGTSGIENLKDEIFVNRAGSELQLYVSGEIENHNIIVNSVGRGTNNEAKSLDGINGLSNTTIDNQGVLKFNGQSQYAKQVGSFNISGFPFSMAARVKVGSNSGTMTILSIGENSTRETKLWSIGLLDGEATINASNTRIQTTNSSGVFNTGDWVHIVGVFNSHNNRELYVDGQLAATDTTSDGDSGLSRLNWITNVGKRTDQDIDHFVGYMDDVRLYSKSLSSQEVSNMYSYRNYIDNISNTINVGSFSINNGAPLTYLSGVSLDIQAEGITHMKFGNSVGELSGSSRISYDTTYPWTLSPGSGHKTVYAALSGTSEVIYAETSIVYEDPNTDGIVLLLDGMLSGNQIIDQTNNAFNLININNGIFNIFDNHIGNGKLLYFNNLKNYAQRSGGINISDYPFAISTWARVTSERATETIVSIGDTNSDMILGGIQLTDRRAAIFAGNSVRPYITKDTRLAGEHAVGDWVHIVGSFDSPHSRTLYVNGTLVETSKDTVDFGSGILDINVGKTIGTNQTNYFYGYIDEIRIYDKSLGSSHVSELYQRRADAEIELSAEVDYNIKLPTSGPVIATLKGYPIGTIITNNNGSDSYTFNENGSFTFFFKDSHGNVGSAIASVSRIENTVGSVSLGSPSGLSLDPLFVSNNTQTITKAFTGVEQYFFVVDELGSDDGYYTTISVSDLSSNDNTISNGNIQLRAIGDVFTIDGQNNPSVSSPLGSIYRNANLANNLIGRTRGANQGRTGSYGIYIEIKIDVPAFQPTGQYTGNIVYTLYK